MPAGTIRQPMGTPISSRGRLDSPLAPAVAALLLALMFAGLRLATFEGNPTGFVWAGDRFVDEAKAPAGLIVRPDSVGFDGAAFYRLGLDPFTRSQTQHGLGLDHPEFRQQRFLYPFLAWLLSAGGRPEALGWALVAINIAGLAALGWVGGHAARAAGRHAMLGIFFPLGPGFALALGLDTAEIVAAVPLLAALVLLRRGRYPAATALLLVAFAARETTLLVSIGLAAVWAWHRLRRQTSGPPAYVFAVPLCAGVAAQLALWAWWGELPLRSGASIDIMPPLTGLIIEARTWIPPRQTLDAFHLVLVVALALFMMTLVRSLRSSAAPPHEKATVALGIVLVLVFRDGIWFHHWGFLRAITELYLTGVLVLMADERAPVHRLAVAGAVWASVAVNMLLFP